MSFGTSFLRRVLFSSSALVLLSILASGIFAWVRIRASLHRAREEALRSRGSSLLPLVRREAAFSLPGRVKDWERLTGARVTVLDESGVAIADSGGEAGTDLRLRPEIVAAAARGEGVSVRPGPRGEDTMFVALRGENEGRVYFVRLSSSLDDVKREGILLAGGWAAVAGAMLLISVLASVSLARRHATPLAELTRVAETVASGRLEVRSHVPEDEDTAAISRALNSMADSLAKLLEQSSRDKDRLVALLAALEDGVVATDARQSVFLVNRAAGRLFDLRPEDVSGRPLWEVVRDERLLKAASLVLSGGGRTTVDVEEEGRKIRIWLSPIPTEGSPEGLVFVARDVTESVRYEQLQRDFVANVSHEVKTPLATIRGFVETLRDGALQDPVKGPEYLAILEKQVRRLSSLVDDLLELSRIENQGRSGRGTRFESGLVAEEVVNLFSPEAKRKNQRLTLDATPGVPTVEGDPELLERALRNVVDNAIKYTPEGGAVRVSVSSEGACVVLGVSDTGIGIPAEDLPRIFERFYRVEKSRSREQGGTGLGLAIAKQATLSLGGSIEVSSVSGQGSTFRILLPAEPASK